ncbi:MULTISPECIES: ATP-binding protein [unclassified Microcoleus]|uniref:ATP-binding protein n=1 Tax=unclassified Microcoleus TaxID=2642155 RepID=UPI002FD53780
MLQLIFDTCVPREEILSGDLSLDLFAAKLRLVVEGNAPQVYQDPNTFFANTFATDGIKTLIREVFGRLMKQSAGAGVIRLETSFGGGKTHDEIALWHICKLGREIHGLERFTDISIIPDRPIAVAAIDGRDLDPEQGVYHADTGLTTYTLWGEIAYQIGGIQGYQLVQGSDKSGVSPGTSVLERLTGGQPTVIILDEIARYLRSAKAKQIGRSDLAKQVVAFLFSLMDLAAACDNLVLVYSLASAADTFAEETAELQETMRASARQERVLSPSTDIEIYNIVKQRVFAKVSEEAAEKAASEYLAAYRNCRVNLPDGCKDASYSKAIAQSYPFHPELFNLLTKKIASIPEFQKTRGALRLFAQVVRHLWEEEGTRKKEAGSRKKESEFSGDNSGVRIQNPESFVPMIHTHHIPVGMDKEITNDLTSRLQRSPLRNAIGADIYNPDGRPAYAQLQDAEWTAAGKPPFSTWISRTIFLHSLTQGNSSGIRLAELNLSLLTPGVDSGFVDRALQTLTKVAWYLDFDPVTSLARFKEEPSINKIITEEKEQVGVLLAKEDLRIRRDSIFAKKFFTLVSNIESPGDVDDNPEDVALCVLDFDEATVRDSTDAAPELIDRIFNNTGESGKFRTYRNRLLFLVANQLELERAIDNAREYKAIQNILKSQNRMEDLSGSQQKQLKEREGAKNLAVRVSLTNAYRHLFYPANDATKAPKGLMHYTLPTQDSSTVKGNNNQQDVILKALKDCGKIRAQEAKSFAPAFILQKVWPGGLDNWTVKALRDAFAKDLSLNILLDAEVTMLRETIREGLKMGNWDMKVGERLFIKTDDTTLTPPETIEFSDRASLYRRGILQPPAPKEVELSAQLMPSAEAAKPVRVKWKAKGSLSVSLYQDNNLVPGNFRPSDECEITIVNNTIFRVVADYGNGETAEKATKVNLNPQVSSLRDGGTSVYVVEGLQGTLWDAKPSVIELDGTVNVVFAGLGDRISDHKIQGIEMLELSVNQVMDYRKLGTAIALLQRWQPEIDQTVTIQTSDQFVRLEYQGQMRGFQSFFSTINSLLNSPDAEATVSLKLTLEFKPVVSANASDISSIKQALDRNPVERLSLTAKVVY